VEVVAEGTAEQLADLVRFLYQGPPSSRVDDVQVDWAEASGNFKSFGVRF
jgi:acylphosphatase